MTGKLSAPHAALLGIILALTGYITWSALSASNTLNNLIVTVPVAILIAVLSGVILFAAFRSPTPPEPDETSAVWGDLLLLSGFALFCYALTHIGFDVATFVFVWAGVVMSGGKGLWQPPLFSALFTLVLVKGFGALFPYPMLTLVL
ncbi:tripartite tricarboxylate transporter TctB family protein [Primorskyibacter flagellatus]|uniref:Tripartite tricarboxylate transporter TctB family protein n=1 Tax=Primorskyibacter flagellatus TaxID=1387277 RepID=A0A1W2EJP9_9RHOB|nr:tripartite tricarboxylate transporter TctB family protein [Primorskyibacter flagellatus]SMD09971.1 Tripartite tricarboxylate transporter TctB family protein [Primorskyibacter flagellatus]